jgi:glutathionyl-hydroquinone reductase
MTPQEKAIQLVEKFSSVLMHDEVYEDSIKCALIAVDEMIKQFEQLELFVISLHWSQVKREIKKL